MKKARVITGVFAVAIIATVLFLNYKKSQNDIVVGVVGVMSGPYSEIGQDFTYGMQFAAKKFCEANGFEIKLVVEDGKAEAKTAVSAFRRLLLTNPIAAIVVGDNQVPSVSPIIAEQKIPTIATSSANSAFLKYNVPETWIFRNFASITLCSQSIARYSIEKLNAKRASVLYMVSEYGKESSAAFRISFVEHGGNVIGEEEFQQESTGGARSQISKLLEGHPDVVFVSGYGMGYCAVMNQLREIGFSGPILTGDSISNPESLKNIKDMHDIYFTNQIFPDSDEVKLFKEEFKAEYNRVANLYTAYGYDSFMLLANAIKRAGNDKSLVRDELLKVDSVKTLLGEISFKANGDCEVPLVMNKMLPDGRSIVISHL